MALAQIVRLVQEVQGGRAPVQRLADRVSAVFLPAMIGLAAIAFIGWWVLAGGPPAASSPPWPCLLSPGHARSAWPPRSR
jgi:cation transport ATPase